MTPPKSPSSASPLSRFVAAIFLPPFAALPIAVFAYFVWCFVMHPGSLIMQGELPDSDDYMFLDQLTDWFRGQDWFDNLQHRMNPPEGTLIDFSRLPQLPMAGLVLLLSPLLGFVKASLGMAFILPLLLFALFLAAFAWAAEPFVAKPWTRATAFFVLFAVYLEYVFSPGHIDHHGLTALLILFSFGFAARLIREPASLRWPIGAGLTLSLALAVGLEILPPLILISACLGLFAMIKGGKAARAVSIYGLALLVGCAVFVALTIRPADWFTLDQLAFSAVYVLFAAGLTISFAGIALASLARPAWLRVAAGIGLAALTGALFLHHFPALIHGPYGAMDEELAGFMFANITEAQPILRPHVTLTEAFLHLIWPLMGLAAALGLWRKAGTPEKRWLWGMASLCIADNLALATFYQIRFMVFTELFIVIPLTAFLAEASGWIDRSTRGTARLFLQLELVLLIAPLPALILPALVTGPSLAEIVMFPMQVAAHTCDMRSLGAALSDPNGLGSEPRLIMNDMAAGSELLWRTPHSVTGGPYHTNVSGNLDVDKFFSAGDPAEAERIIRKRGAAFVTLCHKLLPMYRRTDGARSFAEQLDAGIVPGWLKPVSYPDAKDYLLFEVAP